MKTEFGQLGALFKDHGALVTIFGFAVAIIIAYVELRFEVAAIKDNMPIDPKTEKIEPIPFTAIRWFNVEELSGNLAENIQEIREKVIKVESLADVTLEEAQDDAIEIQKIHKSLKNMETISKAEIEKVPSTVANILREDQKFIEQLSSYELKFTKRVSPKWSWSAGDSACVATCPDGHVLVSMLYENPASAKDCAGGSCVLLSLKRISR